MLVNDFCSVVMDSGFEETEALIKEIKGKIRTSGLLIMNHRKSNAQTLAELNISPCMQREIIENLGIEDYCGGPEKDRKYAWKWVAFFGKEFEGVELYIKLSIGSENEAVICMSFHQAVTPMRYQFK